MFSKHDQWRQEIVTHRRVRGRIGILLVIAIPSAVLSWFKPELHWVGYFVMALIGHLVSEWRKVSFTIGRYEVAIMATEEDGTPIYVERPSRAG